MVGMTHYPKVTLRIEIAPNLKVGPGKILLLEKIAQTGSISAAARSMDMSYRRAWLLIDELKTILGGPAVITSAGGTGGGGARLTDAGENLIVKFRTVESRLLADSAGFLRSLKIQN